MKILNWNIQQGGGGRVERICDAIAHRADVVVLTEFREQTSATLIAGLAATGLANVVATEATGIHGGVAIASRLPIRKAEAVKGEG